MPPEDMLHWCVVVVVAAAAAVVVVARSQRGFPERRIFFLGAMGGAPGWALGVRQADPDPEPLPDPQGPSLAQNGPTWGPTGDICVFGKNNKSTPPLTLGPKT